MKIQVCTGKTCRERYSEYILARLERDRELFWLDNLIVETCPCTGNCKDGPNMLIDGKVELHCNPIKASKMALQLKQKPKKNDEKKRHSHSEENTSEENMYLKDHITHVKTTNDDTADL